MWYRFIQEYSIVTGIKLPTSRHLRGDGISLFFMSLASTWSIPMFRFTLMISACACWLWYLSRVSEKNSTSTKRSRKTHTITNKTGRIHDNGFWRLNNAWIIQHFVGNATEIKIYFCANNKNTITESRSRIKSIDRKIHNIMEGQFYYTRI